MFHPIDGIAETELQAISSIAGQGYRADSHLFLTLPALLMAVSIGACVWRSTSGVLVTMCLLSLICALAAVLGLWRVARTLGRLRLGYDEPWEHG